MQAQPMLLHDMSSNQLVETAVFSTDFSQSAVLQGVLHQPHQHSVEVMVYQYDKLFGYGCWMTSIPTMN